MAVPGLRGLAVKDFAKRLVKGYVEVGVSDSAAQLSYYLLFSLFPFLFFLVTLTAYLPLGGVVQDLLQRAGDIIPDEALDVVNQHLSDLMHRPRPKLLTLGLLTSFYSASRGVDSMRAALNRAYKVTESRAWWKTELLSIGMTVIGTLLVMLAFAGIILGGRFGYVLSNHLHMGSAYMFVWIWLRWPTTALVIMGVAALGYYFLPDVEQRFSFLTPGTVAGTLFWLLATWGLTFYTDHFNSFNVTYGSIGGVVILMTWFYLSAVVFLMGGVMNVVIEHASPEGKAVGARKIGDPAASPEAQALAEAQGASKSSKEAGRLRRLFGRRKRSVTSSP